MNSDLATLVLRAWTASPHSTIQRLDHRSLDVAWKTITSHLIFVLRHPAPPQLICLQAACTLDDILVIILRHLTTEPAISKPQCSAVFSTSSRSRLCSVAPPRAPTWTYVAWAWRQLTRSYRRWVHTVHVGWEIIFEVLGSVCRATPSDPASYLVPPESSMS